MNKIVKTCMIIPLLGGVVVGLFSCSTTRRIPEEEKLYTGINKLRFENRDKSDHGALAEEEIAAVLAYAPNNSMMGSSTMRFPLPIGLWAWNLLDGQQSGHGMFKRWLYNTFASQPVYISTVNPEVRVKVAKNTLANYGYFDGEATYSLIDQRNPKKQKIDYTVRMGMPFVYDSLALRGLTPKADSIVRASAKSSLLHVGDAFNVVNLEEERLRVSNLLRNNGYFYFQPSYLTYDADTVHEHGKVSLVMTASPSLPDMAKRQWHIGRTQMTIRREQRETLTDTLRRRRYTYIYSGEKVPIRASALFRNFAMRRGDLYSYDSHAETVSKVNQMGLFSSVSMKYVPRDSVSSDTLDVVFEGVLDKTLESELSCQMTSKSNDQVGPGVTFGITKRNAFRAGEKLSIKLNGAYEWQTNSKVEGSSSVINSYSFGLTGNLEFPRIIAPFVSRRRFRRPSSTLFSLSAQQENHAGYFRMLSISGGVTYTFQSSSCSRHEFTPFTLTYNDLQSTTQKFDSIASFNPALYVSLRDQFEPVMRYTYTYDNAPLAPRHRTWWQTSVTESGNVLASAYALAGRSFDEKGKCLFGNPFSQFFKIQSELRRTFTLTENLKLATRIMGGVIFSYGNSSEAPFSEQFYVGGANSIRAFTVRSVGPGRYKPRADKYSFIDEIGDMKLEANVELRFPLVGSLNGALFLDAGNVWLLSKDTNLEGGAFEAKHFLNDIALGTGFGLRYDMEFIVVRFDLGVGIHTPYETSRKGYYNIPSFKDGLGLHFAIGYPF